jgi:hypothetical protein
MKLSADTRKAISLILIYIALLFFLIGMAARVKSDFRGRTDISRAGLTAAGVFFAGGISVLLLPAAKRED